MIRPAIGDQDAFPEQTKTIQPVDAEAFVRDFEDEGSGDAK
jgi:hypothetical protein